LTAVQLENLFGFLNVDVSADGKTLVGTFYDNDDGEIKDRFTITKSSVSTSSQEENDDDAADDDEVSAAVSDRENGNEEFSEGNQEKDDDYGVGFDDIDDDILGAESFLDEE
jgi:hypothetical protein